MLSISKRSKPLPKNPEDRPIDADDCCSACLYNIPRGSLGIALPGCVILAIGVVFIIWTSLTDSEDAQGLFLAAIVFLAVGGGMTVAAIVYWTVMWYRFRPETKAKDRQTTSRTIELVSVSRFISLKEAGVARTSNGAHRELVYTGL